MAASTIKKDGNHSSVTMFTADSSLEWSWGTPTQRRVDDMRILCTGVKLASTGSGFITVGQIAAGHRPPTEFRFMAVSQESGESRFGYVDSGGVVAIYNPKAETYWFEAIWAI